MVLFIQLVMRQQIKLEGNFVDVTAREGFQDCSMTLARIVLPHWQKLQCHLLMKAAL